MLRTSRFWLARVYQKAGTGLRPAAARGSGPPPPRPAPARFAVLLAILLASGPSLAFDLQAHRGGRGLAPENSLAAFGRALALGVTTLELDLVASRDEVLLIGHDLELDPAKVRSPDGRWLAAPGPAVRSLDAATLRGFDIGRLDPESRDAARWPQQEPVDGERMPTLAELAALLETRGARTVRLNLETKLRPDRPELAPEPERFAELLVDELRRLGLLARSTVQSFDWRTLLAVRRLAPELETACLTVRRSWLDNLADGSWTAGLRLEEHGGSVPDLVAAAGCRVWSPFHGDLQPSDIHRAENLGLAVVPWTVDEPERMRALIGLGVDGLITDRPDRLRAVMAELGLPLPPSFP